MTPSPITPTIGRIVLFALAAGITRPADVVEVSPESYPEGSWDGSIDVNVKCSPKDAGVGPDVQRPSAYALVRHFAGVKYSEGGEPGTFSWMPYQKQVAAKPPSTYPDAKPDPQPTPAQPATGALTPSDQAKELPEPMQIPEITSAEVAQIFKAQGILLDANQEAASTAFLADNGVKVIVSDDINWTGKGTVAGILTAYLKAKSEGGLAGTTPR